jgi:hypothetical protein
MEKEQMLSIYSSDISFEEVQSYTDNAPYYYPHYFSLVHPLQLNPDDKYRLYLIDTTLHFAKVQHFVVVIQRGNEYYSMGFGSGPSNQYVIKSPDPYMKYISDVEKYNTHAFQDFVPLNEYADKLNTFLESYHRGGYIQFKNGTTGFFAAHTIKKSYNVFTNMCLSGFDSIFPIPTDKLHAAERFCFYTATGRGKRRRTRKRTRKHKKI